MIAWKVTQNSVNTQTDGAARDDVTLKIQEESRLVLGYFSEPTPKTQH